MEEVGYGEGGRRTDPAAAAMRYARGESGEETAEKTAMDLFDREISEQAGGREGGGGGGEEEERR